MSVLRKPRRVTRSQPVIAAAGVHLNRAFGHREATGVDSLWANLPASHKMMAPRYQEIRADQIPEIVFDDAFRFRLISGRPIMEPVAWQGPMVMNTREELDLAFREYRDGSFIKHGTEV